MPKPKQEIAKNNFISSSLSQGPDYLGCYLRRQANASIRKVRKHVKIYPVAYPLPNYLLLQRDRLSRNSYRLAAQIHAQFWFQELETWETVENVLHGYHSSNILTNSLWFQFEVTETIMNLQNISFWMQILEGSRRTLPGHQNLPFHI